MQSELLVNLGLAGIDDATRQVLRDIWPVVRDAVPHALDAIYGQTNYRAGVKPLFSTDERDRMADARDAQGRHWEALFAAEFDEEYAAAVSRVALTHVRVGLRPAWFISGYLVALTELHSLLVTVHSESIMSWRTRSRMEQAIRAVDKAVLFDLQVGVSTYFAEMDASYRRRLDDLAQRCQAVTTTIGEHVLAAAIDLNGAADSLLDASDTARAQAAAAKRNAARASADIAATAAAAEHVTKIIGAVTRQAQDAARATRGAVATVDTAASLTDGMSAAAARMVEMVARIEQLNAESAALVGRAVTGMQGDGAPALATIADQLRALSARTGETVAAIRGEAGAMRTGAADVSGAIDDVHAVMNEVSAAATSLAAAMGQQAEAAREIGLATASAAQAVAGLSDGTDSAVASAIRTADGARHFVAVSTQLRAQASEQAAMASNFVEEIRAADRRAEPREPATASVILATDDREVRGILQDVSAGGASVMVDTSLLPETLSRLTVRVPHSVNGAAVRVVGRTADRVHLSFLDRAAAQTFVTNVLDRTSSLAASQAA